MAYNGPAIWGGCVTRRKHRVWSWYFSQEAVTVQGGYGALFAVRVQAIRVIRVSRYKFDRSREFIPGYKFGGRHWRSVAPCPAEAKRKRGYKLSRSQKFITVQEFYCVQMRVSGCKNHYKFVLSAGAKAKSVTNNLPILSVLAVVIISN
jgi:hypothetical protein